MLSISFVRRLSAAVVATIALYPLTLMAQTISSFPPSVPGWAVLTTSGWEPTTGDDAPTVFFDPDEPAVQIWDLRTPPANLVTPQKWTPPVFTPRAADKSYIWTNAHLGEVFGLAIDANPNGPYIYAAATAIYGSTLGGDIYGCGSAGCYNGLQSLSDPAAATSAPFDSVPPPNLFVYEHTPTGALVHNADGEPVPIYGAVWRLSMKADLASTGPVDDPNHTFELIAKIPSGRMSLGQIAYNPGAHKFYVSNFDDGKIYMFVNPPSGTVVTTGFATYDFGMTRAPAIPDNPSLLFTPYGRRVWGLQYNAVENRLYFAVWNADLRHPNGGHNQIWSVDLNASGDPVASTTTMRVDIAPFPGGLPTDNGANNYDYDYGNNYLIADYSEPVSDIAFDQAGTLMLVAERGERIGRNLIGGYDQASDSNSSLPHMSRTLRYRNIGGVWTVDTTGAGGGYGQYNGDTDAGNTYSFAPWRAHRANSAGGVDFGYDYTTVNNSAGMPVNVALDLSKPDGWGWASTNSYETMDHQKVYGIQGAQEATVRNGGQASVLVPPDDVYFVDSDNKYGFSPKALIGDVEIHRLAATTGGGGLLKICKVAGYGVEVGTGFTFNTQGAAGTPGKTTNVPAGQGPGGWCNVVGTYDEGSHMSVIETGPSGYTVANIDVQPPSARSDAPDLAAGQVNVVMGSGVTEVTFTNERHTGYIEICKAGNVSGTFNFDIGGISVTVPAGACSPAIMVNSGSLVVTESPVASAQMSGCDVYPINRTMTCDAIHGKVTVQVVPGDSASQTVLTVTNEPSDCRPHLDGTCRSLPAEQTPNKQASR